jgi:cyanoexosortase B
MIGVYWTGAWRSWQKTTVLMGGAVFISVVVNILRNTVLTILHGTGRDELFHWLHDSWGGEVYWLLIVILLVGLFKGVNRFWPQLVPSSEEEN